MPQPDKTIEVRKTPRGFRWRIRDEHGKIKIKAGCDYKTETAARAEAEKWLWESDRARTLDS